MSQDQNDQTQVPEPADGGPLITAIVPVAEQIGQHVMSALQRPNTVAVLTTVVAGVDADRVVSMPLTPEQMGEVQGILDEIQAEDEEAAADAERCIGFQCQVSR